MSENDERVVELVARSEKASLVFILNLMKDLALNSGKTGVDLVKKGIQHQQTTGKQRYGQLKKSGSLEHVDVSKTDLSALKLELRKYKVDFAVRYNRETGKYHIFFKAKDRDTLNIALENVLAKFSKQQEVNLEKSPDKTKKASLDDRLKEAKVKADKINSERSKEKNKSKVKTKIKEQSL
ncbi:PcfB family protein [Enterococcus casseliflavus]|uniref:PcfB family protein n=1 Tax=Enterococcus casseliflavus TaxID=37734 RepID=UPI0035E373CB